jgi:RNA polymerase sigma-70 factor (ECF subfamily)
MKKHDEHTLQTLLQDPHKQREAFEEVVRTYSPQLYWQIRRLVFSHDDADDLLQNTFLKAWSNLNTFRGDSRLSTWLYRIALNESLTFLRQKREELALDDPEASIISNLQSDPYFDGDETDYQLQQALSTLPDKQRAVFNMKYYQEMKYEEMSDILHTSVGALKASYHIAVKKIEAFFANID